MRIQLSIIKQKIKFTPGFIGFFVNPSFFCRLGLIKHIRKFRENIKGRILDVGCGSKPYQNEFKNAVQYIGLDIETSGHNHKNENIDVYYDGINIPFPDEYFDSVVCFEVLEHTFQPGILLKEINRVLKMNGVLLLTSPFIWDEHEQPYDFARYTSFGLKHIIIENGFEIFNSEKSIQDLRVIFQLFNNFFNKKLLKMKLPKVFFYLGSIVHTTFFNILGSVFYLLGGKNSDMYLNNIVFAKKNK